MLTLYSLVPPPKFSHSVATCGGGSAAAAAAATGPGQARPGKRVWDIGSTC